MDRPVLKKEEPEKLEKRMEPITLDVHDGVVGVNLDYEEGDKE